MAVRHHEVTRLEGFSDTVFGFAPTLVVSLEVPTSFEALKSRMEGFLGFARMFAMVCWIWYEHNWFFRHTSLQDPWTVFLNSVLIFVVVFYVYPLKFLTVSLLGAWFGLGGDNAPQLAAIPGAIYFFLMGPLRGWNGHLNARARERAVGT